MLKGREAAYNATDFNNSDNLTPQSAGSSREGASREFAQRTYQLGPDQVVLDSQPTAQDAPPREAPIRRGIFSRGLPGSRPTQQTAPAPRSAANGPITSEKMQNEKADPRVGNLGQAFASLAELIANVTEAYSAVLFVADDKSRLLTVGGAHSLSREFRWDAAISYGSSLVGWCAENRTRVSVSPFDNDSTTLLYYTADQALKSFLAVPILSSDKQLLGVIACDSKKNYAFAKVTEKILMDFAVQASVLLGLCEKLSRAEVKDSVRTDALRDVLDRLRTFEDEKSLLTAAAEIPLDLVVRDALVVMTLAEGGSGPGGFYTAPGQSRVSHRLFELVCKHKLLLSGERIVHALPTDDIKQRSFLSVPFQCLGKEAGSFNLLSRPLEAFSEVQIGAIEKIAVVVGRELERIRLRDRMLSSTETSGVQSWKQFSTTGRAYLRDAKLKRQPMTMLRVCLRNLREIEDLVGLDGTVVVMQKIMRLIDQVVRQPSVTCYLYGFQILVLTGSGEADRTVARLRNLIERLGPADLHSNLAHLKVGRIILDGLVVTSAAFPTEGENLEQLAARTSRLLEGAINEKPMELAANAGTWS